MIFLHEIEDLIERLEKAGVNPVKDGYVIYAARGVEFREGVYPLEIVTTDNLPKNTACMIAKKVDKQLRGKK